MKLRIVDPLPQVDPERQRLLELLSVLIVEAINQKNKNLPIGSAVLSEEEGKELQRLLERLQGDRDFFAALTFVDGLFGGASVNLEQLREIYLSQRKLRGYSRAVASSQWYQFLTRIGRKGGDLSTLVRAAKPMSFEHFLRMEERLFLDLGVRDRAREVILGFLREGKETVEAIRKIALNNFEKVSHIDVRGQANHIIRDLKDGRDNMSVNKLAGLTP